MKQIILGYLLLILLCVSCESSNLSRGRKAYKKYFQEIMLDPSSYVLYNETIIGQTESEATFVLDVGGKNSFGGMIRKTYTIKTIGDIVMDVKEYDIRSVNTTSSKKEIPNKSISIQYKELKLQFPVANIKNYNGKTIKLNRDIIGAYNANKLSEAISALKNKDYIHLNIMEREYDVGIIPKDSKIKIDSSASVFTVPRHETLDCFYIKYNDKKFVVEQAQVLCK